MRLISWNINGIRAVCRKGFLEWLDQTQPDILLLQEVKAFEEQMPQELKEVRNYSIDWHAAQRPGYSGVATLIHKKASLIPKKIIKSIGIPEIDCEGRILSHEFDSFTLYNIYYPNGQRDEQRLQYKLNFYDIIFDRWLQETKQGKSLIIGGDVNTAHKEIDLARPKENRETSGFLPIECAWVDKVLKTGFVDTFRQINGDIIDQYSWWTYRANARKNNVGWRIDYFFTSQNLAKNVQDAFIWQDVMGSDHCPVGIDLSF